MSILDFVIWLMACCLFFISASFFLLASSGALYTPYVFCCALRLLGAVDNNNIPFPGKVMTVFLALRLLLYFLCNLHEYLKPVSILFSIYMNI